MKVKNKKQYGGVVNSIDMISGSTTVDSEKSFKCTSSSTDIQGNRTTVSEVILKGKLIFT